MAAIKRTLFPPILNTVRLLTWSALPKVFRNSANDWKSFVFACLYQCCSAVLAAGCFSTNSLSRLRVMICMVGCVYYTLSILALRCVASGTYPTPSQPPKSDEENFGDIQHLYHRIWGAPKGVLREGARRRSPIGERAVGLKACAMEIFPWKHGLPIQQQQMKTPFSMLPVMRVLLGRIIAFRHSHES